MIEPTEADIGRKVVYTGNTYPGGELEEGVITSLNTCSVFVRYGKNAGSQATARKDLEWLQPPDLARQIATLGVDSLLPDWKPQRRRRS